MHSMLDVQLGSNTFSHNLFVHWTHSCFLIPPLCDGGCGLIVYSGTSSNACHKCPFERSSVHALSAPLIDRINVTTIGIQDFCQSSILTLHDYGFFIALADNCTQNGSFPSKFFLGLNPLYFI